MKDVIFGLKRLLVTLLVIAVLVTMSIVPAWASVGVFASGNCGKDGDNVKWYLDDTGVLSVYGEGEVASYYYNNAPWFEYGYPHTVIIGEGVTSIGENMFDLHWTNNPGLKNVKVSSTVTKIEANAFSGCDGLKEITLPDSLTSIGRAAFKYCDELSDVWYNGSASQWSKISIDVTNESLIGANIHYGVHEDIPSSWAKAEVESAISLGIVPEELQKNYKKPISRENVAEMLVSLIEESKDESIDEILTEEGVEINKNAFSDTTDANVLAANALGIINGIGNGKFNPNGTLTRAQIAAMINRVAKVVGIDTEGFTHNFTDVSNHWVNPELGWPVEANIIAGVGNNKFDPDANLTTEQTILIVYRALNALK